MQKSLEEIKEFIGYVDRTYNSYQYQIRADLDTPYGPENTALGYSWRYDDENSGKVVFNVVVAKTPVEQLNIRVAYHEYLHCYLDHLSDHLELDKAVMRVLKLERGQIIDTVKDECGIPEEMAEGLVEAVIDDPSLNHRLHNVAMDMACNSYIGLGGIKEMEKAMDEITPNLTAALMEEYRDRVDDEDIKKIIDKRLKKIQEQDRSKLIHPSYYHTKDGKPFPEGKTYQEYLLMILRNLDQFVKSQSSLSQGGNGDTSGVGKGQIQAAAAGAQSLKDFLKSLGMIDDEEDEEEGEGQGQGGNGEGDQEADGDPNGNGGKDNKIGKHDPSNAGGFRGDAKKSIHKNRGIRDHNLYNLNDKKRMRDHLSPSRKLADKKRELGEISAGGGTGIGSAGAPDFIRTVTKQDEVDLAIDEVIQKYTKRVVKRTVVRDIMRNYNLGRCRSVIVPSITEKYRLNRNPKIVYILDISGSMDTVLVDRILNTIAKKMKRIGHGLKYDLLTWSHAFGEHLKDIEPGKPIPKIHTGGGTCMADALRYAKLHYNTDPIFVLISDFCDNLDEWSLVLSGMPKYSVYGFNYGRTNYDKKDWPSNFRVINFNRSYIDRQFL